MNIQFNEQYDKILLDKYYIYQDRIWHHLKKPENKYLMDYIYDVTPLLSSDNYTFGTHFYWVLTHRTEFPLCKKPECQKPLINVNASIKHGYTQQYCSKACVNSDQAKKDLVRETCNRKYGVDNVFQAQFVKDIIAETCMDKYGVSCYLLTPECQEARISACIDQFGTPYPMQSEKCKNDYIQLMQDKYNVNNAFQAAECIEKIQLAWKNNGYDHPMHCTKIVDNLTLKHYIKLANDIKNNEFEYIELISTPEQMLSTDSWTWYCKKCNYIFNSKIDYTLVLNGIHIHGRCPKCYPKKNGGASNEEYEIYDYLHTIYNSIILHGVGTRSIIAPYELDIYIPDKKLAIEFDGLYWHSYNTKIKNYNVHLNKTQLCEQQGIQLVHIFEDEWKLKTEIVKSKLKYLLGMFDVKISARKCDVRIITNIECQNFYASNSLEKYVKMDVNLGLYYCDKIVAIMTFNKLSDNTWNLVGFCNKCNHHIPGAAGKLLSFFENHFKPLSLISYCDRRWSQGKMYNVLGFKLDHISEPDYQYWKGGIREANSVWNLNTLSSTFETFDKNLSESENMYNNGYRKIYDCGNLVFKKEYNK